MSKIPGSAHLNLSLGGMCLAGGAYGYVKKGSSKSLTAGIGLGSLLLGSGYMLSKTDKVFEGHCIAAGSSGALTLAMAQRAVATSKMMPNGAVAAVGALACAYNVGKAIEWAPER